MFLSYVRRVDAPRLKCCTVQHFRRQHDSAAERAGGGNHGHVKGETGGIMVAQNYALHTTLRPLHTDMCFSHTRTCAPPPTPGAQTLRINSGARIRTRTRASKNQGATTGWAPAGARYEAGIPRRRRETRRRNRTCADGYAPGRRLGMPASYGSPHRVVPSSSSNKGCPRFLSCDPRPPRAEEDRELGDASVAR